MCDNDDDDENKQVNICMIALKYCICRVLIAYKMRLSTHTGATVLCSLQYCSCLCCAMKVSCESG